MLQYQYIRTLDRKIEIEEKIGNSLDWRELPNKKASRVLLGNYGSIDDTDKHEECYKWLIENGLKFKKVFGEYIKQFG